MTGENGKKKNKKVSILERVLMDQEGEDQMVAKPFLETKKRSVTQESGDLVHEVDEEEVP